MIYWELFLVFVHIGFLSFGGGYGALPLIEQQLIYEHGWISHQEFIDVLTVSEMTPGPIVVNAATFSGNQVAGVAGGILATIGVILPAIIIVQVLAFFYFKYKNLTIVQALINGLHPSVVALIATAGMSIFLTAMFDHSVSIELTELNWVSVLLFLTGIFVIRKYKANPIQVMVFTGIIGVVVYSYI